MKTLTIVVLISLLCAPVVFAGEIYGNLTKEGGSVSEVKIEIESARAYYSTTTNGNGDYSIYVKETGDCTLTVYYSNNPSVTIRSYRDSTRYDLELVQRDSGYSLYIK
ncbi:MAG: hypothetical protein GY801_01115 [bacterium]|nr:hypothetical protein [bacterium]